MTLYERRVSAWNATKQAFYDLAGVLEAVKHVSPWRLFNGFADAAQEPQPLPFYDHYDQLNRTYYGANKGAAADIKQASLVKSISRFGAAWRLSLKWTVNLFAFLVESVAAVIYAVWQLLKGVVLFVSTGVLVVLESFSRLGLAMIEGLIFKKSFDRKSTLNAEAALTSDITLASIEEISALGGKGSISASLFSEQAPMIVSSADMLQSDATSNHKEPLVDDAGLLLTRLFSINIEEHEAEIFSANLDISSLPAQNTSLETAPVILRTGSDEAITPTARSLYLAKVRESALAERNKMRRAQKEVIKIKQIEERGICCDVQLDGDKKPLLIWLVGSNKVAILKYAIELYRDLSQKNPATLPLDTLLNSGWPVDKTKGTLLQRALDQQSYACARILIEQGAKISSELLTRITRLKGQDSFKTFAQNEYNKQPEATSNLRKGTGSRRK